MKDTILVTGCAGFIGYHVSHFGSCKTTLLEEGLRNFVKWYKEYEI